MARSPGLGFYIFFMLNSTGHEIELLLKTTILTNKEISCTKSLIWCIYHANKC